MTIEHNFRYKVTNTDLLSLFEGTKTISTFKRRLEQLATNDPDNYDRDKVVGDGFEFLVELILKCMPYNRGFGGIHEYSPVQEDDNGVDGVGLNWKGEKCVIQVKFRGNTQTLLSANKDHLSNMVTEATIKYRIQPQDEGEVSRYFIITTAKGLHYYTEDEFFKKHVTCIGYNDLKKLLDGNIGFWRNCEEIVSSLWFLRGISYITLNKGK